MKAKHVLNGLFLVFLVVGTYCILSKKAAPQLRTCQGPVFGTELHISYEYIEPLDSLIYGELERVDASLSMFNPGSTVSRVNRGETAQADSMLREVLSLSLKVSEQTGGAFDVTVAPLVNAWGFGTRQVQEVSAGEVDSIMAFVGYGKVRLEQERVVKSDARLMLDFSSVAKGYAVDCIARLFDRLGMARYMIEIGGEVRVKGTHPEGRPWNIGVSRPVDAGKGEPEEMQTILSLENVSMATSGNYRRFYERGGKRYAHTIDPHTGRPVQHSLLSATVLAPDCATADAFATAFMVLGLDGAKTLLGKHPELDAYLIYASDNGGCATWSSPGISKYIRQ